MKDPFPGRGRLSTTRQLLLVGVEPGGCDWGVGGDTLLGPEGSGPSRRREPVWCAALVSCASFVLVRPVGWGGGLVGVHLDDLNSGREHLATDLHQGPSQSKSL